VVHEPSPYFDRRAAATNSDSDGMEGRVNGSDFLLFENQFNKWSTTVRAEYAHIRKFAVA